VVWFRLCKAGYGRWQPLTFLLFAATSPPTDVSAQPKAPADQVQLVGKLQGDVLHLAKQADLLHDEKAATAVKMFEAQVRTEQNWPHLHRDRTRRWPHLHRDRARRWSHLHRDRTRRWPHLHRDRARRWSHLRRDWAHICIGTGLAAADICTGTGLAAVASQAQSRLYADELRMAREQNAALFAKACRARTHAHTFGLMPQRR
jgi:hypothetical protein